MKKIKEVKFQDENTKEIKNKGIQKKINLFENGEIFLEDKKEKGEKDKFRKVIKKEKQSNFQIIISKEVTGGD